MSTLTDHFEAARPRLLSLAHRILGSHHDAEDAVQSAWLRLRSSLGSSFGSSPGSSFGSSPGSSFGSSLGSSLGSPAPTDLDAWLTTVTARLCLDQLRTRHRRREHPLPPAELPSAQLAADEAFLRRESVSRAVLVLLAALTPAQRVAYVLHDLFAVPFEEVAPVLGTSTASAKKLASRARLRLRAADRTSPPRLREEVAVVEAFLSAAQGGDLTRLVTLLAPDAVRTADPTLLPTDGKPLVQGATAIADETHLFRTRIAAAVPMLVNGRPGAAIAPGGHLFAVLTAEVREARITRIDIRKSHPRDARALTVCPAG